MVKTLSKMITEKLLRWTYIGLQIWGIGQLAAERPFIILMLLWLFCTFTHRSHKILEKAIGDWHFISRNNILVWKLMSAT